LSPHLEKIRAKAERLTRDFSPEEWHYACDGKWSASLTLEHLLLTFTATTKGTLKAMQAREPRCRHITWRDRFGKIYVLGLGRFPGGIKAPKNLAPQQGLQGNNLRQFNDGLVAMDATLNDAERRFGKKTRILDHPLLGPLTAEEWRRFHQVHAEHHFRQIAARRPAAKQQLGAA